VFGLGWEQTKQQMFKKKTSIVDIMLAYVGSNFPHDFLYIRFNLVDINAYYQMHNKYIWKSNYFWSVWDQTNNIFKNVYFLK